MYRKPLLTLADCEDLVGRLVRFEWGSLASRVDIVQSIETPFTDETRAIFADGTHLGLLGYGYVVFATTPDDIHFIEPRTVPILWDDRHALTA